MYHDYPPADHEAMVRTLAMPKDTNGLGDIFGGWLMAHADMAASIPALRRAGGRVVTVSVNDFQFIGPVNVGDVVSFYANISRVGKTSLAVDVTVFSSRGDGDEERNVRVATARITYVRIGDDRRPCPVKKVGA